MMTKSFGIVPPSFTDSDQQLVLPRQEKVFKKKILPESVEIFLLKPAGKRSLSEVQTFVRSEQDNTFAIRLAGMRLQ